MKWNQYVIKTITSAEDIISATLHDLGVEGVQIEDKIPLTEEEKRSMYIDILPELPPDDGIAHVSFFLDAVEDHTHLLKQVQEELESLKSFMDPGECTILKKTTEDENWLHNWKEFFKPFSVDDIYIRPSWEELTKEADGKLVIQIDPGTAFGTGQHETTQLAIRQLKKYVAVESNVLDVGCGSGILSIISVKLGAHSICGVDIDRNAIVTSVENMTFNQIPTEQYSFMVGNLIEDQGLQEEVGEERYDVVVANILADIIIPLTSVIPLPMKKGGIYITSGIMHHKLEEVKEAMRANNLEIVEITRQGDWVSITARK